MTLQQLTLAQKVGQLFWVRPDALDPALTASASDPAAPGLRYMTSAVAQTLARCPMGGFVLFGKNLKTPAQLQALQKGLAACCPVPPVFCVDEEGGRVARLAGCAAFGLPQVPPMRQLAAEQGAQGVREAAVTIGCYLRRYGFQLNFAPVADVDTNPANPVIGARAFSSDAAEAAALVAAAVQGFHAGGVGCTLKHFPGHGDTAEDSHVGGAVTHKSWRQMQDCELLPFAAGIAAGADAVMAAHITAPAADDSGLPASLSPRMLDGGLRRQLGFTGLIVTDSLGMKAVSGRFGPGEAAVRALAAGADVLLMPADLPAAFDAVLEAVGRDRALYLRMQQSVARILAWKAAHGLDRP